MQKVHCAQCARLISVMVAPTTNELIKLTATIKPKTSKDSMIAGMIGTILPMLPEGALESIATMLPQYCPACMVENNLGQITREDIHGNGFTAQHDARNDGSGEGTAEDRSESGGAGSGVGSA